MANLPERDLNRSYILYGCGGLSAVQSRLAQCGKCHFASWTPGPPDWRLRYITYLRPDELRQRLEDVIGHYVIRFYQEVAFCPSIAAYT